MKIYQCVCGQLIFFENVSCVRCKRELGFLPETLSLIALEPAENGLFSAAQGGPENAKYKKCQNYFQHAVCNWMIPGSREDPFCVSCRLNQLIPDLSVDANRLLWTLMETAKRRLVYSLINLKLPVANKVDDPEKGLAFRFLSDAVNPDGTTSKVLTGHGNGIITLNIAEADDGLREKTRIAMGEPYRTLLGHFRHEIGHYYWDRLIRGTNRLEPYRALFGDETADYGNALGKHYAAGAPPDWQEHYVSAYATAHPFEDWAETWAHFMHIQDALEVAAAFGLASDWLGPGGKKQRKKEAAPEVRSGFDKMIESWSQLAIALNGMNRSMGLHDLYPFVLSPSVIEKLRFVSQVISGNVPNR
jgi:hypothetical protein